MIVNANEYANDVDSKPLLDELDRMDVVTAHGRLGGVEIDRPLPDHTFDTRIISGSAAGYVAYDDEAGRTLSRGRVESGRLPDPTRADEVAVNAEMAEVLDYHVGQRINDLWIYEYPQDFDEETGTPVWGKGTRLSLRVVGVVLRPEDTLAPSKERFPRIVFTPAFAARFPDAPFYYTELLRLKGGASGTGRLEAALQPLRERAPELGLTVGATTKGLATANRANDPLVNGLWILAALAAAVGLLLAAQTVARVISTHSDEHAQLRALGATSGERFRTELAGAGAAIGAAAVLAVIIAFLLSPLTPVGLAREAEPHGGFTLHTGLALATLAFFVVGALGAAIPAAWRVATARGLPGAGASIATRDHSSAVAEAATRAGLGVPAVMGTRLAFQPGRGATSTPVRSVLVSLTLVIAAVTATAAFGINVHRVATTPRLYGWNWDTAIGSSFGTIPAEVGDALGDFPHVAAFAGMTIGDVTINGHVVPAIGIDQISGVVTPVLAAGHIPRTDREIVVGDKTLRTAHAHVGDTITVRVQGRALRLRVVGRATLPAFGSARYTEAGLGTGVVVRAKVLPQGDDTGPYGRYLIRWDPGTAKSGAAKLRALFAAEGCVDPTCVLTDLTPAEIGGYRSASGLPLAVATILTLLLVATLTHVLSSTMRRRRGDLAVLRSLGLVPRQLASVMRWQAVVLTGTALVVGVPLGLLANQLAWRVFTNQLGIDPGTVYPLLVVLLGAVGILLLALLLATAAGSRVYDVARRHRFA